MYRQAEHNGGPEKSPSHFRSLRPAIGDAPIVEVVDLGGKGMAIVVVHEERRPEGQPRT
jgi:hypothetical protein